MAHDLVMRMLMEGEAFDLECDLNLIVNPFSRYIAQKFDQRHQAMIHEVT